VIETLGPNAPPSIGAVYPSSNGYFLAIKLPCIWPSTTPIHLDIFSPEMNSTYSFDEPFTATSTGILSTTFQLFQPGTPTEPLPEPSSPGSIVNTNYAPSAASSQWVRFYTVNPPITCGVYLLRSEARDDDGNAWRLRVGSDNDANPNNPPPPNYDNPDGQSGTGDEIAIGVLQTVFQHIPDTNQCLDMYEHVEAGLASISFHNYDMESSGAVTYTSPSNVAISGTVSADSAWNNGTATDHGTGDVINHPESGWWQITTCVGSDVHIIQEGQTNVIAYDFRVPSSGGGAGQPPSANIVVTQSDGKTVTGANDTLNYQITFTNTSNTFTPPMYPGPAISTVVVSTLPPNTAYLGCSFNPPTTGLCTQTGYTITYMIDATGSGSSAGVNGTVKPGASGSVNLSVRVYADASGSITGASRVEYSDGFSQRFNAYASDVDAIIDLQVDVINAPAEAAPGQLITYNWLVTNTSMITVANIALTSTHSPNATFVSAGDGGAAIGSTVNWPVFELGPNASTSRSYTARVNTGTAVGDNIVSTAYVSNSAIGAFADPSPNDNVKQVSSMVTPVKRYLPIAIKKH
jgi:uncharacterized repeat protein (TIGR01451 family)